MFKKLINITVFVLFISNICLAQKLYVWCPEVQNTKPRVGFLEDQQINLVVFDGRVIPKNSKVECETQNVTASIITYIKNIYPSCKFNILDEASYYKPSEKGKITIKIAIAAYQAGFGIDVTVGIGSVGSNFSYGIIPKGEWNGLTSYYVQIFDLRKDEEKKYQKEISEVVSKSNIWGYKTAKSCLNSCYDKANQSLLYFIENTFMN